MLGMCCQRNLLCIWWNHAILFPHGQNSLPFTFHVEPCLLSGALGIRSKIWGGLQRRFCFRFLRHWFCFRLLHHWSCFRFLHHWFCFRFFQLQIRFPAWIDPLSPRCRHHLAGLSTSGGTASNRRSSLHPPSTDSLACIHESIFCHNLENNRVMNATKSSLRSRSKKTEVW